MNSITKEELKEMLTHSTGATTISLLTATKPKILKTAPFSDLMKFSKVNGMIGFNYSNSVNNQRHREGIEETFEPTKRAWGERIGKSAIISHSGAHYLEVKVQSVSGYFYADGDKVLDHEVVKPYLIESKKPQTQGVEKLVILRDYKLESIRQVNLMGKEFQIK